MSDVHDIQLTADGSTTLYLPDIDEHYHSTYGAVTESQHVYVDSGLLYRYNVADNSAPLRVFEVGLGTGLNCALSARCDIDCFYTAIEKFPLDMATVSKLDFGPHIDPHLLQHIHTAPWHTPTRLNDHLTLRKIRADLTQYFTDEKFDVIYMDAFAPEKQPELWTQDILRLLADMLAPKGVMTTYCAKGVIRRTLQSLGLTVERIPGPANGKREILRASKL